MEHKPALYALIRLHADLGGKIKDNASEARKLRQDMKHVEAVLQLLEPGFNTNAIAARRKNKPNPLFKWGSITRAMFAILRNAERPMTAEEIARELYRQKGVEEPSRERVRHLCGGVDATLRNYREKAVECDDGRPRRWRLTE